MGMLAKYVFLAILPGSLDDVPVPVLLHVPVAHVPEVPVAEVTVVAGPAPGAGPPEGEGAADKLRLPQTDVLAVGQVRGTPAHPGQAEREPVPGLGERGTL